MLQEFEVDDRPLEYKIRKKKRYNWSLICGKNGSKPPCTRLQFIPIFVIALYLSFLAVKCLMAQFKDADGPIIQLNEGKIQGSTIRLKNGNQMDVFWGVPYAEPPVDENRYEKTVPLKKWDDIKSTTKRALGCPTIAGYSSESEDCLYLNIFRPNKTDGKPFPLLFMIHGGAFEMGDANRYANVEEVGNHFVANGLIVVAIQYRLSVLAFASDGSKDFPGNLGYWDQTEALKFVHRNAKALGADPQNITVFGYSAGSAAVSALSISPHSRDYVPRAICMSGSMLAAWATSDDSVKNTATLLEQLGGQKEGETAKQRLKRASLAEIYAAMRKIPRVEAPVNFVLFGPRVDGDFFPKDFPQLIADSKPRPMIYGMNEEESLLFTLIDENLSSMRIDSSRVGDYSAKDFEDFVHKHLSSPEIFGQKAEEIHKRLVEFYLGKPNTTHDTNYYLQKHTQLLSDLQFNIPILWDVGQRVAHKWPVYLFENVYVNPNSFPNDCPIKLSHHAVDQRYLILRENQVHYGFNDDDAAIIRVLTDMATNFTKNAVPTSSLFADWPPANAAHPTRHLRMRPHNSTVEERLFGDRDDFWKAAVHDFAFDLIRWRPKAPNADA